VLAVYLNLSYAPSPLPFRLPIILYFFAVVASAFQAEVPEVTFFYCWQLARTTGVYVVTARACSDARVAPAILKGMAAGLIMEAIIMIWQRFGLRMFRPSGNLIHQNMVGMVSFFAASFFSLLLAGRRG
jgi:hypothetical protein